MNDNGFESQQGLGIFLLTTASRPALRPTKPPNQWVPGALSLWVKRPGREVDHSPPSSAEVTPPFPIRLRAWCSVGAQGQLYRLYINIIFLPFTFHFSVPLFPSFPYQSWTILWHLSFVAHSVGNRGRGTRWMQGTYLHRTTTKTLKIQKSLSVYSHVYVMQFLKSETYWTSGTQSNH
jgi:hypothetical protein